MRGVEVRFLALSFFLTVGFVFETHANCPKPRIILHVSLEAPNASVGGIGGYLGGLLKAEATAKDTRGCPLLDGRLITPFYDFLKRDDSNKAAFYGIIPHEIEGRIYNSTLYELKDQGVHQYLIQADPDYRVTEAGRSYSGSTLFDVLLPLHLYSAAGRGSLYFQSAVAAMAALFQGKSGNENISVLHLNTGRFYLTSALLALRYNPERIKKGLPKIGVVTTIHDTGELSLYIRSDEFERVGLLRPTRDRISPLSISNLYSDASHVVSESLVEDLCATLPEKDLGLGKVYTALRTLHRLFGINNGIVQEKYDITKLEVLGTLTVTSGYSDINQKKQDAKTLLHKNNLIGSPTKPLFLYVGRISPEKGVDLLARFARFIIKEQGGQVVIMGTAPGTVPPELYHWLGMQRDSQYAGLFRVYLNREADQNSILAPSGAAKGNLIRFASDFTLVPSHTEAFGLVPLEALSMGSGVITSPIQGLRSVCRKPLKTDELDEKLESFTDFTCIFFSRIPGNLNETLSHLTRQLDRVLKKWNSLEDEELKHLRINWIQEGEKFRWNMSIESKGYGSLYEMALTPASAIEIEIRQRLLEEELGSVADASPKN